ncbi:MAG: polysaccharide deacetylase family protein [Polyangiaceae bacterium]|nr:polysaccharide deacetylase family protein [Polyangiaceae bacterium]
MSSGRVLLIGGSLAACALGGFSLLLGPPPFLWACFWLAMYAGLLCVGFYFPRLEMFGPWLWRVPGATGALTLSFDGGPDPFVTPALLDTLRRADVRATFFIYGQKAEAFPDLLQEIVASGHELGLLGYSRSSTAFTRSGAQVAKDLERSKGVVRSILGCEVLWFRPPGAKLSQAIASGARQAKLEVVGWSATADQIFHPGGAQANLEKLIHRGAILQVVMSSESQLSALNSADLSQRLERLLDAMRDADLQAVTLSQLLERSE